MARVPAAAAELVSSPGRASDDTGVKKINCPQHNGKTKGKINQRHFRKRLCKGNKHVKRCFLSNQGDANKVTSWNHDTPAKRLQGNWQKSPCVGRRWRSRESHLMLVGVKIGAKALLENISESQCWTEAPVARQLLCYFDTRRKIVHATESSSICTWALFLTAPNAKLIPGTAAVESCTAVIMSNAQKSRNSTEKFDNMENKNSQKQTPECCYSTNTIFLKQQAKRYFCCHLLEY